MIKSVYLSCRGPKFGSPHPSVGLTHNCLQPRSRKSNISGPQGHLPHVHPCSCMETFNCLYVCFCVRVCAYVCRFSLKPEAGARSQALDLHIENCEPMDVGTRTEFLSFSRAVDTLTHRDISMAP